MKGINGSKLPRRNYLFHLPIDKESGSAPLAALLAELTSGDDARAEKAVHGIIEMGKAAIPYLVVLTQSLNPETRWWAVRTLASSENVEPKDLVPLLSDPEPEVRAAAALALCSHPIEEALPALIETLNDQDDLTAGLAAKALSVMGPSAVPALVDILKDMRSQNARVLALRVLAEIGDHRSIPVLMEAVENDSALAQYWARTGLERLGLNMIYIKPT